MNAAAVESAEDLPLTNGNSGTEAPNPYLDARRSWNSQVERAFSAARTWQIVAVACLLIALGSLAGIVVIGAQSKFIPYVIEVDHLGEALAVRPADRAAAADARVVRASLASFIASARSVTPDVALERDAVFRVYAMLENKDPATLKIQEWWNQDKKRDPFTRASSETVSVDIATISQISESAWQVDWLETTRDRDGNLKSNPVQMRAILHVYTVPLGPGATAADIARNPLGIYIQNFDWSQIG